MSNKHESRIKAGVKTHKTRGEATTNPCDDMVAVCVDLI